MIEMRDVHKAFGSNRVLRGVNLSIPKGTSMVIIGGSGTGKSVALKCILGLIKPDSGMIYVDGKDASKGDHCQKDHLIDWLKAAKKDRRIKVRDPELAAKVFRGLVEGMINFPALYSPLQSAKELEPLKREAIAVFLSRYGAG